MAEEERQLGEGLTFSRGELGMRIGLEGDSPEAAFFVLRLEEELLTAHFGAMVQADYNFLGELVSAGFFLNNLWRLILVSQRYVLGSKAMAETLLDIGADEVFLTVDLAHDFTPGLIVLRPDGKTEDLGDEVMVLQGSGSEQDPLVGNLGQRGMMVSLNWDETTLKCGIGNRLLVRFAVSRKVDPLPLFRQMDADSFKTLWKEVIPISGFFPW